MGKPARKRYQPGAEKKRNRGAGFMKGQYGGYYKKPKSPYATKKPPKRHLDAAFSDQEKFDFFNGVWVGCRSERIDFATYDAIQEELTVVFKDGFKCWIQADEALAESFANASSKGGWWHDQVDVTGRPWFES